MFIYLFIEYAMHISNLFIKYNLLFLIFFLISFLIL